MWIALCAVASLLLAACGSQQQTLAPERTYALLLNGGGKAESNHLSHFEHLQGVLDQLEDRGVPEDNILVFASDGRDPEGDLRVRDVAAPEPRRWLLEGSRLGAALTPRDQIVDSPWGERSVDPATTFDLFAGFGQLMRSLGPLDTLFVYVTDHGLENKEDHDNNAIALWHEELDVDTLRSWLSAKPDGTRVVFVMSQCFSGSFADAVLPEDGTPPDGETCGFYAVPRDRPAFGCFPEGLARGPLGHGYLYTDALARAHSFDEAHRETLLTDAAPDVPLRTSDVYLERQLREALGEDEDFVVGVDGLAASLPEEAWAQLDALSDAYGLPRTRSLSAINDADAELAEAEEAASAAEEKWEGDADALARALLSAFAEDHPAWQARLEDQDSIESLDAEGRRGLEASLLDALDAYARADRPVLRRGLERARAQHERAHDLVWQIQIQRATLARQRVLLTTSVGARWLTPATPAASGYKALRACEQTALGPAPAHADASAPQPPSLDSTTEIDDALSTLGRPRLGIRFGAAAPESGAAVVVQEVAPETAAERAGLLQGDLVLGAGEEDFVGTYDIKAWVLSAEPHTPHTLRVLRGGAERRLEITLGED